MNRHCFKIVKPKKTYLDAVNSETAARKYLLGFCWKNHQRFCPRCRTRRLYRLADERYRCSCCRYTFHDLSRRWISLVNISCEQWLRLVKYHQLNVPARRAAAELGVSAPTACRGYRIIGLAKKAAPGAEDQSEDPFTRSVRQLTGIF
jgi:transposase